MPPRLSTEEVSAEFKRYGYTVPSDFAHETIKTKVRVHDELTDKDVTLSIAQLRYRVNKGQRPEVEPYDDFMENMDDTFKSKPQEYQRNVYGESQEYVQKLLKKENFTIKLNRHNYTEHNQALAEAMRRAGPELGDCNVSMTITDFDGHISYGPLNENTVSLLMDYYAIRDLSGVGYSPDLLLKALLNARSIEFEYLPNKKGNRFTGGFLPYWNKSDIDLTRYGIFKTMNDEGITDSCLLQAVTASGLLTDDEINYMRSLISTRAVPRYQLKHLAEEFDLSIQVKTVDEKGQLHSGNGIMGNGTKMLNLVIVDGHYMLNENTNVSQFYIENYDKVQNDEFASGHARKHLIKRLRGTRSEFAKEGIPIYKLVKLMKEHKLLEPMTKKDINKLCWSYKQSYKPFNRARPIVVKDKKEKHYKRTLQTNHFFGYDPEPDEIPTRIKELQQVIDELGFKVDVSLYYKFSNLMQKLMYDYGCFEGVYEFAGKYATETRNKLTFAVPHTYNNKPFYSNERLYYLDLNSAYLSCIKDIPAGLPDKNGKFPSANTKIKELIDLLYAARVKAKKAGNNKLATTLKAIMTSCWGYSIQKAKKTHFTITKNLDKYLDTYWPYVVCYDNEGRVRTMNSVVINYTYPQFAESMLAAYAEKMEDIRSHVHVIYENIDSILVSESDYFKLKELGYVDDYELGKLKIEKIFDEIAILSSRCYVATTDKGEQIIHPKNIKLSYDAFKNKVISKLN